MKSLKGNTVLVTGGGSGIGAGLAGAFHARGNRVIVAGRRADALKAVTEKFPGIEARTVDMTDAAAISTFAEGLTREFPDLNVVINNAGIMRPEAVSAAPAYLATAEQTVVTNLLGPIRLTAAFLPHLQAKSSASVMMVTSGLAFVPYVGTPTYSATKAGLHSYAMAIREQLRGSSVAVTEIAPPYVQTELLGPQQATDPNAMPLAAFIDEVMAILESDPAIAEVIVERCKMLRNAESSGSFATVFKSLNSITH